VVILSKKTGEDLNRERIFADTPVGVRITQEGIAIETKNFTIVYSKNGIHAFPS